MTLSNSPRHANASNAKGACVGAPLGLGRWWLTVAMIMQFSFRSVAIRKASFFGLLAFAACLLVLFPFAFGTEVVRTFEVRHGAFWSIQEFVAALMVGRMFQAETEQGALEFLLASRAPRFAVLVGKALFNALQMLVLQLPFVLIWIVMYNIPAENFLQNLRYLLPVCGLFNLGTSALGALLTCAVARSQAKEILLPILFFPLQISVLLAAVTLLLRNDLGYQMVGGFADAAWWSLLLGFPLVFFAVGYLLDNALLQD